MSCQYMTIDTCHKTSHWIISYQIIIILLLQIYYVCVTVHGSCRSFGCQNTHIQALKISGVCP